MKKSSAILLILLGLFLICLFGSIGLLKGEYNKIDKSDPYWNYTKVKRGSFRHLKIEGGNMTRITFSPSPHGAVGVLNYWEPGMDGRVETAIVNDTLYLTLKPRYKNSEERDWMKRRVLVTISCPDLRSVEGTNTNLNIYRLRQRDLDIRLAGDSKLEVESYIPDFDSLSVHLRDSSQVTFEMSEELRISGVMHARALYAQVEGNSLLDVGHFQFGSLHEVIGDTAGIILSGVSVKQLK